MNKAVQVDAMQETAPETATNAQWQVRKEAAIARGQGNIAPVYIDRALNAEMWDVEGNRYIDFGTGIAVCNTGHMHPEIKAAVEAQLDRFSHTCVMVTPYDSAVELAEKLNALAPGDSPKKSIFVTTGAEAVENCVKIARASTGRRGVIAFNGGFHGRTIMAMGLTGKVTPYKNLFGPFPGEVYHAPFPIPYHGITEAESLKAIDNLFKVDIAPQDVAAIIIEPVQGEGGFYAASPEFMQSLRALCDAHGILLIMDEVQSGFGRTGKLFCFEHSGVRPDVIVMAKGLGSGLPISAIASTKEIMSKWTPGTHGGTYGGGSAIACAAASATIDVLQDEGLIENSAKRGKQLMEGLRKLQDRFSVIGDVRGYGLMVATEFSNKDGSPNEEHCSKVLKSCIEKKLLLLNCGSYKNVIRWIPPLIVSETQIEESLSIFEAALIENGQT